MAAIENMVEKTMGNGEVLPNAAAGNSPGMP